MNISPKSLIYHDASVLSGNEGVTNPDQAVCSADLFTPTIAPYNAEHHPGQHSNKNPTDIVRHEVAVEDESSLDQAEYSPRTAFLVRNDCDDSPPIYDRYALTSLGERQSNDGSRSGAYGTSPSRLITGANRIHVSERRPASGLDELASRFPPAIEKDVEAQATSQGDCGDGLSRSQMPTLAVCQRLRPSIAIAQSPEILESPIIPLGPSSKQKLPANVPHAPRAMALKQPNTLAQAEKILKSLNQRIKDAYKNGNNNEHASLLSEKNSIRRILPQLVTTQQQSKTHRGRRSAQRAGLRKRIGQSLSQQAMSCGLPSMEPTNAIADAITETGRLTRQIGSLGDAFELGESRATLDALAIALCASAEELLAKAQEVANRVVRSGSAQRGTPRWEDPELCPTIKEESSEVFIMDDAFPSNDEAGSDEGEMEIDFP
ncbi:MAG: hypothetical protein Q9220_001112 [cf. Caloplaca sp. 1 TL-2023]